MDKGNPKYDLGCQIVEFLFKNLILAKHIYTCQNKKSSFLLHRLFVYVSLLEHVMAILVRPGHTNVFDQNFQFLNTSDEQTCYSHFPGLCKILSGQGVLQGRAHLATSTPHWLVFPLGKDWGHGKYLSLKYGRSQWIETDHRSQTAMCKQIRKNSK